MSETVDRTLVLSTPEQLRAIADPVRQRLLQSFAEPRTVKAVAELLGEPLSRLYHHVDQLLAAGLVRVVEETRRRGAMERTLQVVARRFVVAPYALHAKGDAAEDESGRSLARAMFEDLLAHRAPGGPPRVFRLQACLTPEALDELETVLEDFTAKHRNGDGLVSDLLMIVAQRP